MESINKYQNLRPVLIAEGYRKPPTPDPYADKGVQVGSIEDQEEAKLAKNLDVEFRMVIEDWARTPAYGMLMKGWSQNKAFLTELNSFTLRRLTANLEERRHFERMQAQKEKRER